MVFKNLCIIVLWMELASALEGLTHITVRVSLESIVFIYDTFDNNFAIKNFYIIYVGEFLIKF